MKLFPLNKYIVLKELEQEKEESLIALPEGYKKKVESHKVYQIDSAHSDSIYGAMMGYKVILPTNAVEEINVSNHKFLVCSEHSVVGILSED